MIEFKELIGQETLYVHGISVQLSNSQNTNFQLIRDVWQNFNKKLNLNNQRLDKNWRKYGVTYQNNGSYYYLAAIPYKTSIPDFEVIELPEERFANFHHKGAMYLLKKSYFEMYKTLLPKLGVIVDKKRSILHYELYDSKFYWNSNNSVIDIFVPVTIRK